MDFRPPATHEIDTLDAILGPALHFPGGSMREWMQTLGLEHMRAVVQNGRIVAGLGAFPFAHWFGGRKVAAAGVTAVGVAPDARGSGVGTFMLRASLEELRHAGVPLASLYPATLAFYRRAGYERAAYRVSYELPLTLIQSYDHSCELVPFAPDDPLVRRLYEQRARTAAGQIERPDWMWPYRLAPRDKTSFRYLIMRNGTPEGCVAFYVGGRSDPLVITDCVVLTPEAGRRVLTLLTDYHSILENAVWNGGPLDPLVYLLRENLVGGGRSRVSIRSSYDLMLRIVDPARALEARGYPAHLRATLELNVRDEVLPANTSPYLVEIADGRAQVTRGGRGTIQLGIRELAMLYTGFAAPHELRALGTLSGDDEQHALLGMVFSGPRPWIADMF